MMKTALVVLSFVVIATAYKDLTQNDIKKIYGDVFQLFQRNDYEPIPDVNRLSKLINKNVYFFTESIHLIFF